MTIIVANVELSTDNKIYVNSSSNGFTIKVGANFHEINSSSIQVGTSVVNSSGRYISGSEVLSGNAGDYVVVNSFLPQPNNTLLTGAAYSKALYPEVVASIETKTSFPFIGSWFNRTTANTNAQFGVAYGNGVFVAVGAAGSIQSSTDGITWANRTTANTNQQNGVAYGNGVFVAVGALGSIQTSTNGTTWTNRTGANTSGQVGITYGNGIFVSVGFAGSIQTSTNGTTWTNRTTANTNAQNGVAYGNGIFVAVGDNGSIQTSTNGTTWTNRTTLAVSAQNITSISYGNGVFVAVGQNGLTRTSTDGITWTPKLIVNDIGLDLTAVTYGTTFVAVGPTQFIKTSADGNDWYTKTSANTNIMNAVTYGNGVYVAVGSAGAIQSTNYFDFETQFYLESITTPAGTTAYVRSK